MELDDRPSMMHRILWGGGESKEGLLGTTTNVQSGGEIKTSMKSFFHVKAQSLFLMLFVIILVVLLLMKMINLPNTILKDDFDSDEIRYIQKWRRVLLLTLIFIVFIILFHLAVAGLFFLFFYLQASSDEGGKEFEIALQKLMEVFWMYTDKDGQVKTMMAFYVTLFTVLLGMFIFFLLYTLFVKGYITNMYFGKQKEDQDDQPRGLTHLYMYSIYMIGIMLFIGVLTASTMLSSYKDVALGSLSIFYMVWCLIFCTNILRYQMSAQWKKYIIHFVIFGIISGIYYLFMNVIFAQ